MHVGTTQVDRDLPPGHQSAPEMASSSRLPKDVRDPQVDRARLNLARGLEGMLGIRAHELQLVAERPDFVIGEIQVR
jgi:hypothetical protein